MQRPPCDHTGAETLAAGLLGAVGIVFASWLAYSAAQEASSRALAAAHHIRASDQIYSRSPTARLSAPIR